MARRNGTLNGRGNGHTRVLDAQRITAQAAEVSAVADDIARITDEVAHGADIQGRSLDDALMSLAKVDERKGRVVELRYFGGLSVEETAEVLGVSVDTVTRDRRRAKALLRRELSPG